ncbi:MAG: hypothetical protein ACKV0T_31655 [Planctomycetales bacterium]
MRRFHKFFPAYFVPWIVALGLFPVAWMGSGGQHDCLPAEPIPVEQAGDHFVNFVLNEIELAREKLPAMAAAADLAVERIVNRDGQFLSAGDQSFSLEPVWRAGGIAFARQYLPEKQTAVKAVEAAGDEIPYYRTREFVEHFTVQQAGKNDVVLVGFENEKQEQQRLIPLVEQLLKEGALVVFFGSDAGSKKRPSGSLKHDEPGRRRSPG